MESPCLLSKINEINSISISFIKKKIKAMNLPILVNHMPLFYILSVDGKPMYFTEIMTQWGISKSSLSDILAKYENLGLIDKLYCKDDKRSIYVYLKPEAMYIVEALKAIEKEFMEKMLKNMDAKETDKLTQQLEQVLLNLQTIKSL
ncbi:MarR family winged helix-turn-helix transcriptional regulator [Fusibacter sp. 3D3]|uniref:MarR family winged helix-turn-helix transcriptional regulator n=1 Tax=Fusibacter sp. 3D3 TaxID=1048380 RepID=UPI000853C810|nr:MarR family transcriptional regulator [Fusibacter sp. 3D3]GAU79134.1 transcriptional regulator [Fusibacter sp. 3D3]